MNLVIWTMIGFSLASLQVYLSIIFSTEAWTPQLWCVFCLWLATRRRHFTALAAIFFTGFLLDGYAGNAMGSHAFIGITVFFFALQMVDRLQLRGVGLLVLGLLMGLLSIIAGLVAAKIGGGVHVGPQFAGMFGPRLITSAIATVVCVPILELLYRLRRDRVTLDTL